MYENVAISPQNGTKPKSKYVPIRVRQRKQAGREHLLILYTVLQKYRKHSPAQHSAISPHIAAKQFDILPIRVRQRKQADRVCESTHVVE